MSGLVVMKALVCGMEWKSSREDVLKKTSHRHREQGACGHVPLMAKVSSHCVTLPLGSFGFLSLVGCLGSLSVTKPKVALFLGEDLICVTQPHLSWILTYFLPRVEL